MIKFFVTLTMFFMALTTAVILFICFIFSLAVFDYVWNTDIKESLRRKFGQNDILHRLREKTESIANELDSSPMRKERY